MITREIFDGSLLTNKELWEVLIENAPITLTGKGNISLYIHIAPDKRVYVGVSKNVWRRWGNKGKRYTRKRFKEAIEEFGWNNFRHHIIKRKLTEEEADLLEQLFIAYYNATDLQYGFNKCTGGTRRSEYRHRKVICLDTNVVYDSAYIAEKETGVLSTLIILNCNDGIDYAEDRKNNSSQWMFYDEYLLSNKSKLDVQRDTIYDSFDIASWNLFDVSDDVEIDYDNII